MTQLIIKNNVVKCRTTVPYPPDVIKDMKKAGYKIKEIPDETEKPDKRKSASD